MTGTNEALALRTKLLVAEYGRNRVIAALAQVENVEIETIEREVDAIRKKKPSRRRSKTLPELLEDAGIDPGKFSLVERIARAYENKRYLPELWRVRQFLDSHGVDASKPRTRVAALPMVIMALARLTESELTGIAAELNKSVRGDLGIIADQILGLSEAAAQGRGERGKAAAKQGAD